ncbi:MAG: trypsin-like serine protease, partial [Corynebacterium sp.]|uniref:trypsin-like serine protease n=1 Tax=Corynebacterium sp. TaxID=1720 RepID=UPI0026DC9212
VGTGISTPQAFSLATTKPSLDSTMNSIGFSGHNNTQHDFSSKSQIKVVAGAGMWKNEEKGFEYHDISDGLAIDYPICFGDSGGPLYQGRTLYGVNSGVSTFESADIVYNCTDRGYFANVNSHIPWIQKTMRDNNKTSLGEQFHAFKGGTAVKIQRGCDINKSLRNPAFGSSVPSVSKCHKK